MEEVTEEDQEDVAVAVAVGVVEDIHIISHIMMEVSPMCSSRGVLWVLAVALVEDIGITVVVVMGMEIITVIVEIGNMVVDMIVKMVNGDQSMIIGVNTMEVAVDLDLLISKALDTIIIIVIMSTNADNRDHVDT